MKTSLAIVAPLTLRASANGKPRRFNILAYSGGELNVDGFDMPVIVDLAGLEVPASVPILIDHTKSVEATLGITDSIVNTGTSLTLGGVVTGQSPMAKQVLAQSIAGHQWQASIGAMVGDREEIAAGQSVEVNGQTFVGPVIVARRSVLRETSVLPIGADSTTRVNLAASAAGLKKGTAMSFEQWCASLGIDPATLDDTNRAALSLAFDAAQNPQSPTPTAAPPAPAVAAPAPIPQAAAGAVLDLTAANKAFAANLRKNAEIQAKAAGYPMIAATAIENGWSVEKVELEVLKASQAKTRPTSFRSAEKELAPASVLEAAVCMARKTRNVENEFAPEILQAAQNQYGSIGLKQLFLSAAVANGYIDRGQAGVTRSNVSEVLAYANKRNDMQNLQAGFSTLSLPGILSNVANKEILTGYMEEDQVWKDIAKIKSVSDFKAVTCYRMLDDVEFEELGQGGTIKHGKLSEETYTRQAKTYAKMFSITRTDIINDDLGAFDDLRARIGRGSAKKLNKVFWTAFLNNGSFFTSGRTNYITGSTSNLLTDGVGLGLGVTAFRKMTSPTTDGTKRVGAGQKPSVLLVPPELEFVADKLYVSGNLNTGSAAGEENIFRNKYKPVVAWQLSDSAYTGYSATAWYLMAEPGSMPTMVVSFLNGAEVPTVDMAESEFNTLGVQFRGYHDFGCDQAEYLGGLKSKGAA